MMIERDKPFTTEDLLNNPPKAEHLIYRNSLEVGMLEEWQDHLKVLKEATDFMESKIDEMRRMFQNGTTWQEVCDFSEKVAEDFEYYQDEIKWHFF